MKRLRLFSFLLIFGLLLGACGGEGNEENTGDSEQNKSENHEKKDNEERDPDDDLSTEITNYISTVESMETTLDQSSNDVQTINENGKTIEEEWDMIEKKVEEQHPDHYEKVEESLYPLIEEAQKDKPDVKKVTELTQATVDSLKELHQSIGENNNK